MAEENAATDRAEKLRVMEAMLHAAIKTAIELDLHDIAARLFEIRSVLRRSPARTLIGTLVRIRDEVAVMPQG